VAINVCYPSDLSMFARDSRLQVVTIAVGKSLVDQLAVTTDELGELIELATKLRTAHRSRVNAAAEELREFAAEHMTPDLPGMDPTPEPAAEPTPKRKRGRPAGSKDSKSRKRGRGAASAA